MRIKPWRTDIKRWLETPPKVEGDTVYTNSRHHQVRALNADTGATKWVTDVSDELLEPPKMAGGDTVLVQGREGDSGSFYGLNASDGKVKWSRSFEPRWKYEDNPSPTDAPIVLRRNPLAGEDFEPMLMGISSVDGRSVWELDAKAKNWGFPVRDDSDRLFVTLRGKDQNAVMALNGQDGSVLWTQQKELWGQPKVLGESVLLPAKDGVTLLDSATGTSIWNHQQRLTREPLITEESVVVATLRNDDIPGTRLSGLHPETGEVMWHYDTPHLTGVAQGPEGQLLHHAYKLDENGVRQSYVHGLDNKTGQGLWSFPVGYANIEGVGADDEGRVLVALRKGSKHELVVLQNGEELWRQPTQGKSVSVVGNAENMAVIDREGITVVDAATGQYQEQVAINSPLVNHDGRVGATGRITMSGIDGEMIGMELAGAQTIMEPTSKTPGSMRHYRYDIAPDPEGNFYADVKADGEFVAGEDALLVRVVGEHGDGHDHDHGVVLDEGESVDFDPVTAQDFDQWDTDSDGYLSRTEMNEASLSLWWDRDGSESISRPDGLVAMKGEGRRQAVVDLDRQKLEVRNRRAGA